MIASLEQQIAAADDEISQTISDYSKLQELTERKDALEQELAQKMERWVYLTELAEKIEAQGRH